MKLISLNTWGGKIFDPLIDFIKEHSRNTDIFCFQEIYDTTTDIKSFRGIRANLLWEIKNILRGFSVFYFPVMTGFDDKAQPVNFPLNHGSAIFIKNSFVINHTENYFIVKDTTLPLKPDYSNISTGLQWINFSDFKKNFSIFNFHGTPYPGNKLDTKRRLLEVTKVKDIIDSKNGPKILAGDFNLLPQTESIHHIEENMRNLIKEFDIKKTRSDLSPFFGKPQFQKFADYIFVSEDIKVESFQVPDVKISDHLPMILQFS